MLRSTLSLLVLLLVNSCTEQKITSTPAGSTPALSSPETGPATTSPTFHKGIGSPIDRATALRWIANFAKVNPTAPATEHFIDAGVLKRIVSNSTCVGVSLHYSRDGAGHLHIIPIGTDSNGKQIPNLGIDIGDSTIDWQTQQRWITNYTGNVRSHFFGTQTFSRLVQAEIVRITMALDDSGNPQLLLSDA
ncbi:MAG TPA: hypothetical protein VL728_08760, partial [Cyclobacteriaceae bacterium]|nr:hypothetical protein [Cyclobacteriaceae bacterium]